MKLLTYIFSFAYFLTISCGPALSNNHSSIAATVNDKSILNSDVTHRINLLLRSSQGKPTAEQLKNLRKEVLQQMIDETLQLQTLDQVKIKVSAPEMDIAWGKLEQNLGLAKGQLHTFLKENNIPAKIVMNQIRSSLGWQQYIMEKYGREVQVTEAEIKAELATLEKRKQSNQVLLSEIVLNFQTPEQKAEAKAKANEIFAKIRAGAPFPIMAQQYSHSAAARGGDIGWISEESMDPEIKKAVQSAHRGDVTAPIETKGSYRILGVRDRHGVGSLGESVEYVSFQQIEFNYPMFEGEEGAEETRLKANTIRNSAKTCAMMKKLTDGRPRIKTRSIEHAQMQAVHPELARILKTLKPGTSSELMNTGDGLIMFMVCNKDTVKPHEPDAKEIRNMLREKKLTLIYEKELRALRGRAFIDVKSS